jgi:hypothetical protein
MKLSAIKNDVALEEAGRWFDYLDGFRIRIRSKRSPTFQKTIAAVYEPHKHALQGGRLTEDMARRLTRESIARAAVVDWEGLESEDGEPIAFSEAKAVELFVDPAYRELFEFVDRACGNDTNYRIGNQDDAGN